MYENPLHGWEIVTVVATTTLGYFASDVLDRFLVSRDRSDPKDTTGKTLLGKRWNTAPLTDDLLVRGGVGVAVAAVPLIAAHFIGHDMARSALQGFGVGAAVRLLGKAADDLATYLLRTGEAATDPNDNAKRSLGRRLYGTELNSRIALSAELPEADRAAYAGTAGLGAAPCPNCGQAAGLGRCNCGRPSPMLPDCEVPSTPTGPQPVGQGKGNPMAPNCPPTGTTPGGGIDLTRHGEVVGGGGPSSIYVPPRTSVPTSPVAFAPATMVPRISAGLPGLPNGLGSVEHAQQVLRTYEPAYRAIRSNAGALAAHRNGTATPSQRDVAERVTQSHAEGIRAMASFHPATLETAARGLGFLSDGPGVSSSKWPGASRHRERDDAAE